MTRRRVLPWGMPRATLSPLRVLSLCLASGLLLLAVASSPAYAGSPGGISGKVTDANHGGLAGIKAAAYRIDSLGSWGRVADATTAGDGGYQLTSLSAGAYRICFSSPSSAYIEQWYADSHGRDSATDVVVVDGQTTTGIDASLAAAAHIVGVVTDAADGAGLAGIDVIAYQANGAGAWTYADDALTAVDGSYQILCLTEGTYRLRFQDLGGVYMWQFWDNAPSLAGADGIALAPFGTATGVDAMLATCAGRETTPPTTVVAGVDTLWHRSAVTVTLTAIDNAGGSGVNETEYRLSGAARWSRYGAAPLLISAQGSSTFEYRSIDAAQNAEPARSFTVRIDSTGPSTSAKAAKGRRGRAINLRCLVSDDLSPQATDVHLVVRNSRHKVVRRMRLGTWSVATWYSVKWKPKSRGTYNYTVYADDLAGNHQGAAGSARIRVR